MPKDHDAYTVLAQILGNGPGSTPLSPPIYQTTAFSSADDQVFAAMCDEPRHTGFYTRYANPNIETLETAIATLEGAEAGLATASGMAAVSVALLSLVNKGEHVVAQKQLYGGTLGLLNAVMPRFGVDVTFVDQREIGDFEAAFRAETRVVFLETPSNPLMHLTDLKSVAKLARDRGVTTIVDNTVASPLNQKPLDLGVDLVVHSATKSLSGHSDVTAGAIVGRRVIIDEIWRNAYLFGMTLDPMAAWLALRGMRTLPMRIARYNETAMYLAGRLNSNPRVVTVHYPGLATHPQHQLAREQMTGFGGLLSFEVDGGESEAARVIANLKLAHRSASFGSHSTLAVHPAKMWRGMSSRGQIDKATVPPGLIRLSVGFENAKDLADDLEQALSALS